MAEGPRDALVSRRDSSFQTGCFVVAEFLLTVAEPLVPSSVDSVATYSRKKPNITQFSTFELDGGAT